MSTDIPRRAVSARGVKLALVALCYLLALPFELLVIWSALQVIFLSVGHAAPTDAAAHVAVVTLARAHPLPFAVFAVASLGVAFIGATVHRSVQR
jgi:hypothetical protein